MNRRIGVYAVVMAPLLGACTPQPVQDQEPQVISQRPYSLVLPHSYELANARYDASQFSSMDDVVSIRDQLRTGLQSLSSSDPAHGRYRQEMRSRLERLDARVTNHESYLTLKQGIVAWLQSDQSRLESLASSKTERGGYLWSEEGQMMFDDVQRDDTHEIDFRDGLERLIAKVKSHVATEAEYTQLIERVRVAEGLMLFRLSHSGVSSAQEQAQLERVNLGLHRMSEYLQEQYGLLFQGNVDAVPVQFIQAEQDFLRLYTLMIINSGINIPPPDRPDKITVHTHPDFGPGSEPRPSEIDLGLSRGLEVFNQDTGQSRPATAGFVIAFSGKKVSVYGYDFGQYELIGEFTRE